MTHEQSKLIVTGKLKNTIDLCGRGKPSQRVAKMVLFLSPRDMLTVMDAIAAPPAEDLQGVGEAGNQHGRCLSAICREWLAKRGAK